MNTTDTMNIYDLIKRLNIDEIFLKKSIMILNEETKKNKEILKNTKDLLERSYADKTKEKLSSKLTFLYKLNNLLNNKINNHNCKKSKYNFVPNESFKYSLKEEEKYIIIYKYKNFFNIYEIKNIEKKLKNYKKINLTVFDIFNNKLKNISNVNKTNTFVISTKLFFEIFKNKNYKHNIKRLLEDSLMYNINENDIKIIETFKNILKLKIEYEFKRGLVTLDFEHNF